VARGTANFPHSGGRSLYLAFDVIALQDLKNDPITKTATDAKQSSIYQKNKRLGMDSTFHGHSALLPVHPWSAQ